jgi:hypothetical protein
MAPLRPSWMLALAIAAAAPPAGAEGVFQKGPYLQHLGTTSLVVRVELSAPIAASIDIQADGKLKRTLPDADARYLHDLRVTGLEAATHYRYTVHAGAASAGGELTTAPLDESGAPFTFIVYGDNRTDPSTHASVVRAILQAPSDFLLNTGDYVQEGGEAPQWQEFFDVEAPLLCSRCLFACVGNHELVEDKAGEAFLRYLGPSEGMPPRLYGSFRWGSARIFLLNAFQDWGSGDERTWLEDELVRADHESGLKWRFAVIHHSPFSAGHHGNNQKLLAAQVPELLAAHNVDLIIGGHDHIYERGDARGLRYLISGGGGAPLYRDITPLPGTRKAEAAYHYVLLTVAPERVTLLAKRIDGSVLDSCGFGHGVGWDCEPPGNGGAPPPATTGSAAPQPTPAPAPTPTRRAGGCGCGGPSRSPEGAGWLAVLAMVILARRRARGSPRV